MKILFLTHSGQLGGAEIALANIAEPYRNSCLVGLFEDGPFRQRLEQRQIPVQVLTSRSIQVRRDSGLLASLSSITTIAPLILRVANLARHYDLVYASTLKALVVGSIASALVRRPLVYHLRDILSSEHFSATNRKITVTCVNQFVSGMVANSAASKSAFIAAGGRAKLTHVVHAGLHPPNYQGLDIDSDHLKRSLGIDPNCFLVGHFSRLSPWKGQHVLIEALPLCPPNVKVMIVGDALFGEQDYVQSLHQRIQSLGLENRVYFLGFRSDIPHLMTICDLVVHSSTAPEPFGLVIVEAMLCRRPVVASDAGGAREIIRDGETGWLITPGDPHQLAAVIKTCCDQPKQTEIIAQQAHITASQQFNLVQTHKKLTRLLDVVMETSKK